MAAKYKVIITGIVIALELMTLCYVSPRVDISRAVSFESVLSKVCINSGDLFEVNKRAEIFSAKTWGIDERKVMYYCDSIPQKNKIYWIYFGPLPCELSKYYYPTVEEGREIYLIKGLTWKSFREDFAFIHNDYIKGDEPYIVTRD